MRQLVSIILLFLITACSHTPEPSTHPFSITQFTDAHYPDNPDIGFRSQQYSFDFFSPGNHSFHESHPKHEHCCSKTNSYFAFLADEQGNWLDSHEIGIDGPIFHWDDERPNLLHLWLLSFERHTLVGHYEIQC